MKSKQLFASALYRNKYENGLGVVFGIAQKDRDRFSSDYITKIPAGAPAVGAISVNGAI